MNFNTKSLINYGQKHGLPDYVKTASTKNFEEIDDPKTKVGCFLAKFASLIGEGTISAKELEKRAKILNISDDLAELEANYRDFLESKTVKTAAPTEKYPLRNKNEVKAAISWLNKNAYTICVPERRDLAERIIEKAAEFAVETNEQLEKFAGEGHGNANLIAGDLVKRAALIRRHTLYGKDQREKTAHELEATAAAIAKIPAYANSRKYLDKIAEVVQFLDNEYGLQDHYCNGFLKEPDALVCSNTTKTAREIEQYSYKLGNAIFDIRDFENIKVASVLDIFGEDFVEVMSSGLALTHEKIAMTLDVMTALEKEMFMDLVKEAGIEPKYVANPTVNLRELTKEVARLGA